MIYMQARPVIPLASFAKATRFRKLIDNILDSFARENTSMPSIITSKSEKDANGNTVTKYIADPQRYHYILIKSMLIFSDSYMRILNKSIGLKREQNRM